MPGKLTQASLSSFFGTGGYQHRKEVLIQSPHTEISIWQLMAPYDNLWQLMAIFDIFDI